ncbi:hypothetical protein TNCV_330851 [Trichonephila clavipes]|nr:hypothetical protein TNCV_330851 [Trichonephila clavipes]
MANRFVFMLRCEALRLDERQQASRRSFEAWIFSKYPTYPFIRRPRDILDRRLESGRTKSSNSHPNDMDLDIAMIVDELAGVPRPVGL